MDEFKLMIRFLGFSRNVLKKKKSRDQKTSQKFFQEVLQFLQQFKNRLKFFFSFFSFDLNFFYCWKNTSETCQKFFLGIIGTH